MPIDARPSFPVESPQDVAALVELLGTAATDQKLRRSLGDHFAYVAGVHRDWFRPLQETVVTRFVEEFDVTFDTLCVLLHDAPDSCVAHLSRQLRKRWDFRQAWALAAIGTEAALTAVADLVRDGIGRSTFADSGIWVPPAGPAQRRFSSQLRAVHLHAVTDTSGAEHPVGLPLAGFVRDPAGADVAWHYLSLRIADVPGMPDWPAELVHLAGPTETFVGWTLTAATDPDGRWSDVTATYDDDADDSDDPGNDTAGMLGGVTLRPYDADLVYSNGHILSTPGVAGVAGGPPIGLYPNPHCRSCGRLMFHVVTVQSTIREHGDGWRTLYVCEQCHLTTCTATNWN